MRIRFLSIISCFLILSSFCGCAKLRRAQPLIELGRSDKLKERALKQETENFRIVKTYIESKKIQKNLSKDAALKIFGEPVIVFSQKSGEKWVYKEAESSWFGGEKIYLFFDKQDNLINWEHTNPK